ncbi:MAG: FAD-dependent oxidoreductase [Bacillota bacterium]|nr:FAD-dependent oxidoreductase [Bacillota bacterium]
MKRESLFKIALIIVIFFLVYQFGIAPTLSKNFYFQGRKNSAWAKGKLSSEPDTYDVIVYGSEPDGIAAAISAARAGAKTLLISEDKDLGGYVEQSLYSSFDNSTNSKGKIVDRGLVTELYSKMGENLSLTNYINAVNKLVKNEGYLTVEYDAKLEKPVVEGAVITGLNVSQDGKNKMYSGKIVIDATRSGNILEACGVPYFYASGDLSLAKSFEPAALNFELSGVDWASAKSAIENNKDEFYKVMNKYETSSKQISIDNFSLTGEENGNLIVDALKVSGVDFSDGNLVKQAYNDAVNEAKKFAQFLSSNFRPFKNAKFVKAADSLYLPEYKHFKGEYTLTVNDILSNKDFKDKIAVGSAPVNAGKLSDSGSDYIMGKPDQYGIPLGCIIPANVDNLLMTGSKISYSSLASTSADRFDTSMSTGEASGVVAVYSLFINKTPREIAKTNDKQVTDQLENLLKRQGMYLPDIKTSEKAAKDWTYDSVKQLRTLGLIAGGQDNNYKYSVEATCQDLAMLLLNGVYRAAPETYSLELDARLRPYFTSKKLTETQTGRILAALNDVNIDSAGAYDKVCNLGYIDNEIQKRLSGLGDEKALTMDMVYYIAANNIKQFTGKSLQD